MQPVDPFTYPDWNELLLAMPQPSFFHTTHWLQVLQESYGYQPYYFASFTEKQLAVLLPFMEVKSWITGVRGVSLPFTDYCEPIMKDETTSYMEVLAQIIMTARQRQWQSLEMRGGDALFQGVLPYTSYYRHVLVLHGGEEAVFSGLRSNYRAKIRKARESGLTVTLLRSPEATAEYYRLHCLTRKRHGLPPQPVGFFQKIHKHIIAKNFGFVALVSHQGRHVAGAIFFTFGTRAIYKFGASDVRHQHLHPNYLLFWHVMQWLCHKSYTELCFGRTDLCDTGLIQFKDGWGVNKHSISYYKYNVKNSAFVQKSHLPVNVSHAIFEKMPIALLKLAGSVLYKHMG
jgi:hypothetical protein